MEIKKIETPKNLFSLLSANEKSQLHALGKIHVFAKDQYIYQAVKSDKFIYILLDGHAKIFHVSQLGKEVILWFCSEGEMFGLAECLVGEKRKTFAQVSSTTSSVLSIPDVEFKHFLENNPKCAIKIIQLLSDRMCRLSNALLILATENVESRVIHVLNLLAESHGTNDAHFIKIDFHITHQEIADMIGSSRQTVTSTINHFKKQNRLQVKNHHIHLIKDTWFNSRQSTTPLSLKHAANKQKSLSTFA